MLEVKNRPGQVARELSWIKGKSSPIQSELIPDLTALFKSTTSKFRLVADSTYTQGVMLFLGIKIPAAALEYMFRVHLQSHLHFIALAKEDKEAGISVNILASSPEVMSRVKSAFNWTETADLLMT